MESEKVKLATPTNVECSEATETTLTLSWDPVPNATGYMVMCKDVLEKSWEGCVSAMTEGSEASVVVENLYPTATFEVKVVALSNCKGYVDSDESEIAFFDTKVGSCTPENKKCFGLC
ncbi:hypothetical protein WA577_001110 [Blastocystis sp. JDR]